MHMFRTAAVLALTATLAGPIGFAQSNTDMRKAQKEQLKRDHEAEKAQAKADKKHRQALDTSEQKDADKAQDKANEKAAEAHPY